MRPIRSLGARRFLPILAYTCSGDAKRAYRVRCDLAGAAEVGVFRELLETGSVPKEIVHHMLEFVSGGHIVLGNRREATVGC